jgi:hypothetical protein
MITDALNIARMGSTPTRQTTVFGLLQCDDGLFADNANYSVCESLCCGGVMLIILRNIVLRCVRRDGIGDID